EAGNVEIELVEIVVAAGTGDVVAHHVRGHIRERAIGNAAAVQLIAGIEAQIERKRIERILFIQSAFIDIALVLQASAERQIESLRADDRIAQQRAEDVGIALQTVQPRAMQVISAIEAGEFQTQTVWEQRK